MSKFYTHIALALTCLLFTTYTAFAQIAVPRGPSPQAEVSQTIGLSTINVNYSRPSVRDRQVYGTNLAHYGFQNLGFGTSTAAPWRAGANENTIITFSHDMTVGGKPIKAGTYGYFIALAESGPATLILSKNSTAWGSFFYNQSEDALRVNITPQPISHQETLIFEFNNITPNSTTLMLKWEKLGFPIKIEVAVADIVLAEARKVMQDQPGFNRQTYEQAAGYALQNGGDMPEALGWINNAIEGQFYSQKTFTNHQIKAGILTAMGRADEATALMDQALDFGTVLEIHQYGRQQIASGNVDKALAVFKFNAKKYPNTWPVHYGMARAYSAQGDFKNAIKHLNKALANAPDPGSKGRVQANLDKLNKGEDIN